MKTKTEIIRRLNDKMRTGQSTDGHIVITSGVQALGEDAIAKVRIAVAQFNRFNENNDPHGEHDFGAFDCDAQHFFWKIDYYDKDLMFGSPDASDPNCTSRVLTILLAEEY
ncbi:MAG: DUF3768 domain-containing protein [Pseudoruegeria sp.]